MNESRLEEDANRLRAQLSETENQLMMTELWRQSLEGDTDRMKLELGDKETENHLLSCRADDLTRRVHDLESKAHSLNTTVDRLNLALAKTEQQESAHKSQVR